MKTRSNFGKYLLMFKYVLMTGIEMRSLFNRAIEMF